MTKNVVSKTWGLNDFSGRRYSTNEPPPDPGDPFFSDEFDYVVDRNQSQSSAEDVFQANGWNAAALSNGTGESHGYLYTVEEIDGFAGVFPGTSPYSLCMESYPNNGSDTSFLQADYWLQFGDEALDEQGHLPPDLWVQYWIYLQDDPGSGHVSTYPNRNKFLYPVVDNHPGNSNPLEGPVTIAWLFVMGAQAYEASFGPTNENFIGLQAYGADKDTTSGVPDPDNNLHQNLSSKRIAANEWTLVKLHIDISGTQGVYEAWLRAQDEEEFTKVSEWIGGVTPNFTWPTYVETRAGHKLMRTPTTENANPGNNPARDGDGNHFKYLRDIKMATAEADLPVY